MMILCDTNILIEFYKNDPRIIAELQRIGLPSLAASVITVAELFYGAIDKAELKKIKNHLSLIQQIPLTRDISIRFLKLMDTYALSHRPGIPDVLIAATALELELHLFTLNVKDFLYIPDLTLHSFSASP